MKPRFIASARVEHSCCWRASVIDTHLANTLFVDGTMFCECDTLEIAEVIASALNKQGEAILPFEDYLRDVY
jgi:hypothetical protein